MPEVRRKRGGRSQHHLEVKRSLDVLQEVIWPLEALFCRAVQGSGQCCVKAGTAWPETYLTLKLPDCSSEESMPLFAHNILSNLWARRGRRRTWRRGRSAIFDLDFLQKLGVVPLLSIGDECSRLFQEEALVQNLETFITLSGYPNAMKSATCARTITKGPS